MKLPAIAATWLMPSAMPRRSAGNASVMIAVELANSIAPPTPWTIRQPISHNAPATAGERDRAHSAIERHGEDHEAEVVDLAPGRTCRRAGRR